MGEIQLVLKYIILIMIAAIITPLVNGQGTLIQYSDDNESWINVTNTSEINKSAYQINLFEDTRYFGRAKNDTTNWTYFEFTTDSKGETNTFMFYTVLLIIALSFVITYLINQDWFFSNIAGSIFLFVAIDVSLGGFLNLTSALLKTVFIILFSAFAYMLLLVPNLKLILGDEDD